MKKSSATHKTHSKPVGAAGYGMADGKYLLSWRDFPAANHSDCHRVMSKLANTFVHCRDAATIAALALALPGQVSASTTLSVEAIADTFLTSDPGTGSGSGASQATANTDNSGYGAMMISANVAAPGQGINYPRTMSAFVAYDMATIKAGFDAQYGAGQWAISDVSVKFYSNFSISGVPANNNQFNVPNPGYFTLSWISNNSWFDPATAGAAGRSKADFTWNNRNTYLAGAIIESVSPAGGFYWAGGDYNGATVCGGGTFAPTARPCFSSIWSLVKTANLINDIKSGGYVSLMGTPADAQVVYLINQLTKPDAHPRIFVTADASAATPAPTPTPSPTVAPTPTPAPCHNDKPEIDAIQNEWLVHAAQQLAFAVTAFDCQGRAVAIKTGKLPKNAGFTQNFDSNLGKQKGLFAWTPGLADVETIKSLQFMAAVKTKQGVKSSPIRQSKIQVLPPALGNTPDPIADASIAKLAITRAVWHQQKNQIDLQGQISWKKAVTRDVRAEAIARMVQILDVATNAIMFETQANLAGGWKLSIALPQGTPPPSQVEAEFRGKISLPKKIKPAQ